MKDYYGNPEIIAADTVRNNTFRVSSKVTEVMPVSIVFFENKHSTSYTAILEDGSIKLVIHPNGRSQVTGGKYNKLLFGYQSSDSFIKTADSLDMLTSGGKKEKMIKGSEEETKAIDMFMRKERLRSDHLEKVMNNTKDIKAKVMAAILLELQPDSKEAMKMVNKAASQLGEGSYLIKRARKINEDQEAFIERRKNRMTGTTYSDFTAATITGDSVQLAPIVQKNRYTLLQFWASWCIPCRKEIPLLKNLYKACHEKGLEIVSFSIDSNRDSWQEASKKEGFMWPNISDLKATNSPVYSKYPIMGIPANVIISQDGKIIASNLTGEELEKKIFSLFQ